MNAAVNMGSRAWFLIIRVVCEITHFAWLFSKSVKRRLLATQKVKLSRALCKGFAVLDDWRDEGSKTVEVIRKDDKGKSSSGRKENKEKKQYFLRETLLDVPRRTCVSGNLPPLLLLPRSATTVFTDSCQLGAKGLVPRLSASEFVSCFAR